MHSRNMMSLLLLGSALFAQAAVAPPSEELTQATARLHKALAATAALPNCGFAARWAPTPDPEKKDEDADDAPAKAANMMVFPDMMASKGEASGAWDSGQLHVAIGDDLLRFDGRRMLARGAGSDWVLRSGRFADGNKIQFAPDPKRLLDALSRMGLVVAHRAPAALDDRPVEVVSATLSEDQAVELLWDGLLPQPPTMGGINMVVGGMVAGGIAGGRPARPAEAKPAVTVDLALHFDPGTGLLQRLHFRCYSRDEFKRWGGRVIRLGGGGAAAAVQVVQGNANGQTDDEDEAAAAASGPAPVPTWVDGLRTRSHKNMIVSDLTVDLRDHGSAHLPELDDAARQLLGR